MTLKVPAGDDYREIFTTLPKAVSDQVRPGDHADFVIYATQNVDLRACAVVPLAAEVPPPPPEPWPQRQKSVRDTPFASVSVLDASGVTVTATHP